MKIALAAIALIIGIGIGIVFDNSVAIDFLGIGSAPITFKTDTILESIQQMSQLTTVRYNYSSLITSERAMPGLLAGLYGERMLMVAVGHVDAGINLRQLTEDNIRVEDEQLIVTIPTPTLTACILNESASYIVSHDTGLFARNAPNMDSEARRFALVHFRDSALEDEILEEANMQTVDILGNLIGMMTGDAYEDVQIEAADWDTESPLPETCQ